MCDPAAGDGHYFVWIVGTWLCCKCGAPAPERRSGGDADARRS